MQEKKPAPFALRALVAALIAVTLVTAWLQPLYEMVIVGGGVLVPRWWQYMESASLLALLLLCFLLMRRDRRLCIAAWCAFWVSLLASVMPSYLIE